MLERIVHMSGAYDLTRPEPAKNYGIHAMELSFVVKGPDGAVNLTIQTRWYLPHVAPGSYEMYSKYPFDPIKHLMLPDIIDIGFHARVPSRESQHSISYCPYTDGPCYHDGTSLWGNEAWRLGFLHGGTDWLWSRLEELYRSYFENGPEPDLTPVPRKHPKET